MATLTDIHARQRKLLRLDYSHASHFLALVAALPKVRRGAGSDIAGRRSAVEAHARSAGDTRERLAKAQAEVRVLRAAYAEAVAAQDATERRVQEAKVRRGCLPPHRPCGATFRRA